MYPPPISHKHAVQTPPPSFSHTLPILAVQLPFVRSPSRTLRVQHLLLLLLPPPLTIEFTVDCTLDVSVQYSLLTLSEHGLSSLSPPLSLCVLFLFPLVLQNRQDAYCGPLFSPPPPPSKNKQNKQNKQKNYNKTQQQREGRHYTASPPNTTYTCSACTRSVHTCPTKKTTKKQTTIYGHPSVCPPPLSTTPPPFYTLPCFPSLHPRLLSHSIPPPASRPSPPPPPLALTPPFS